MQRPISIVVVAVLATMVSATHMRVEETALRSGFIKFIENLFGIAKAVDPPPVAKMDLPPVAKLDAPPVAQGQKSRLILNKEGVLERTV